MVPMWQRLSHMTTASLNASESCSRILKFSSIRLVYSPENAQSGKKLLPWTGTNSTNWIIIKSIYCTQFHQCVINAIVTKILTLHILIIQKIYLINIIALQKKSPKSILEYNFWKIYPQNVVRIILTSSEPNLLQEATIQIQNTLVSNIWKPL